MSVPWLHGIGAAFMGLAIVILVNGLDDLLFDLCHLARLIRYRLRGFGRQPLTHDKLRLRLEAPAAILVPAWQEAGVIGAMLDHARATLDYAADHIFVGVYPNDPGTRAEVLAACQRWPRIRLVELDHPGPTSKGDCLNAIARAIQEFERTSGIIFGFFVLHDAEDVVHADEMKLFNYLISKRRSPKDMVQLPVLPLSRRWDDFTSGHYLGEFAESHAKDLYVREWLARQVPSAGVGCAISRRAFLGVTARHGTPFNTRSVTEDYDFALRLARLGYRQVFARVALPGPQHCRESGRESGHIPARQRYVAVREYFPNRLRAAVRQKSRWLTGIVLQGWAEAGWRGPWRLKYALWRDRKALAMALLTPFAYLITLAMLLANLCVWLDGESLDLAAFGLGPEAAALIGANSLILTNRLLCRAACVGHYYGGRDAALSLPYQVWGNVVNFLAACRAVALFLEARRQGRHVAWDKTSHEFPAGSPPSQVG